MIRLGNARIVDVDTGAIQEGSVVIEGSRIAAVESTRRSAPGEDTIDLDGGYLLPGLVTCHTHLSIVFPFHRTDETESPATTVLRCRRRAREALRAGVTTVRTVGELHRADIALRESIRLGFAEGPRIVSGGKGLSVTGGHGRGFGAILVDGPEGFRRAAREEIAAGADHLKIFISGGIAHQEERLDEPQMSFDEMEAVVAVARSIDTYVCAHAGGPGAIRTAIDAGVVSFEHGYRLDRETCRRMKQAGCYLVPTLSVTRSPEWMRENGFEGWTIDKATSAAADHLDSVRLAVREGVRILNGTDMPPGDRNEGVNATVREMEHLAEAGMSPLQVLQASTWVAAELMKLDREIGRVAPGLMADLIAVRDNPVKDVRALEDIYFVMQSGRVVRYDDNA